MVCDNNGSRVLPVCAHEQDINKGAMSDRLNSGV